MHLPLSSLAWRKGRGRISGCTVCTCQIGGSHLVSEMREGAVEIYGKLYTAEVCDLDVADHLLGNLPQLSPSKHSEMESPITFQELCEAVDQMALGPAWRMLRPDWYEVLCECLGAGELPLSCRRAVLVLLPKKGDRSELNN